MACEIARPSPTPGVRSARAFEPRSKRSNTWGALLADARAGHTLPVAFSEKLLRARTQTGNWTAAKRTLVKVRSWPRR